MKLLLGTLCVFVLIWMTESHSHNVIRRDADDDDLEKDDDFSMGMNLDDFEKDIQREIEEMTKKTRKVVADVLNVDESKLNQANYKKSNTVEGKKGNWRTRESAAVDNKAKEGKNYAFESKSMVYNKVGVMKSGDKDKK